MRRRLKCNRLVRALAIVAFTVVVLPAASAVAQGEGPSAAEVGSAGLNAASVTGAPDPLSAIERIEEASAVPEGAVPGYFAAEIGVPPEGRDVRVDASGKVVGYMLDYDCAPASEKVECHMSERGWSCVPLGNVDGATYVKEGGSCRWALVTCTQVDGATSVVFRCVVA